MQPFDRRVCMTIISGSPFLNLCGDLPLYMNAFKEMRAVTAAARSQEAFAAKEVVALKAEIEDFEKRLAFSRSGVAGGNRRINSTISHGFTTHESDMSQVAQISRPVVFQAVLPAPSLLWNNLLQRSASITMYRDAPYMHQPFLCCPRSRLSCFVSADATQEPLSNDDRIRMEVRKRHSRDRLGLWGLPDCQMKSIEA